MLCNVSLDRHFAQKTNNNRRGIATILPGTTAMLPGAEPPRQRRSRSRSRLRARRQAIYIQERVRQQVFYQISVRAHLRALRYLTLMMLACYNLAGPPPADIVAMASTATWTQLRHHHGGWQHQMIFDMDIRQLRHHEDATAQLLWLLDDFDNFVTVLLPPEFREYMFWHDRIHHYLIQVDLGHNLVVYPPTIYSFVRFLMQLGTVLNNRYVAHRTWLENDAPFDVQTESMNYYLWLHRRFPIVKTVHRQIRTFEDF